MMGRWYTSIRSALDWRTPGYLIYFVTARCDCRCKMCFNARAIDAAGQRNPLTLDEVRRIAQRFPGLHNVNFSGGEPFLRTDFAQIPPLFYEHSGARFFACPTNSSQPEHIEQAVDEICKACPDAWVRITQSLDGIGSRHDQIRGMNGLFERVVELNQRLARLRAHRPNLSVGLTTVVSRYNADCLFEILDYVYDNLSFQDYGTLLVRGETRDADARDVSAETFCAFTEACKDRRRTLASPKGLAGRAFTAITQASQDYVELTSLDNRYIMPCQAGRRMVIMDDEGVIEPCEILAPFIAQGIMPLASSRLGSMRDSDYDIRKILASEQAREVVRKIKKHRCRCTFECAWSVNVLYTPRAWVRVLRHFLRLP